MMYNSVYEIMLCAHTYSAELQLEKDKNMALKMRVESVLKQRDRQMEEAEARDSRLNEELDEVSHVCVNVYIYVYICICIYVCIYMCMYIYVYT